MAIRFVESVYAFGICDTVAYSLLDVERITAEHTDATPWVTSLVDSRHKSDSYHYLGGAWDVDLVPQQPPSVFRAIRDDLRAELGEKWDIIYEDPGNENGYEHLHGEFENRQFLLDRMAEEQQRLLNRIRGQPG